MKIFKTLLVCFFMNFLSACQTGVILSESNMSVSDHRKAIVIALREPRTISQNGREISSHFHDSNFKFLEVNPKIRLRYYTKVIVLGARRPYDVSVQVRIEERDPKTNEFEDIGLDEDLSLKRALAIKDVLNQSRDRSQTIDGSNPF